MKNGFIGLLFYMNSFIIMGLMLLLTLSELDEGSMRDLTVGCCFLNSRSGYMHIEDQGRRRCPLAIDNQHRKTLINKSSSNCVIYTR